MKIVIIINKIEFNYNYIKYYKRMTERSKKLRHSHNNKTELWNIFETEVSSPT